MSFLNAWLRWRQDERPGYSYGMFARSAGLGRSTLPNILKGRRRPGGKTVDGLLQAMKLAAEEAAFFRLLVSVDAARDTVTRSNRLASVFKHHRFELVSDTLEEQVEYLADWRLVAVRELVRLADFREEPTWIAKRLGGRLSRQQAAWALERLFELELLARDPSGRAVQVVSRMQTSREVHAATAYGYHCGLLEVAAEALMVVPPSQRQFTAATIPLPRELVEAFKREVHAFIQDLGNRADEYHSDDRALFQLNVQFFPLEVAETTGPDEGPPDS